MAIPQSSLDQVLTSILASLKAYQEIACEQGIRHPFVLGLTGLQGSGKSTWTSALATGLRMRLALNVVQVSLDDFYLDHGSLMRTREKHPLNPLLRTRGQPGTHDQALMTHFFSELELGHGVYVPAFDKSAFNGEGDRVPKEKWEYVSSSPPIDIVIFEGWCLGFRAMKVEEVEKKWKAAGQKNAKESTPEFSTMTFRNVALHHLLQINSNLQAYNDSVMAPKNFNFFIHLDTDDLQNVYRWRLDQEHHLW